MSLLYSFFLSLLLVAQYMMMGTWLPETCWATNRREIKATKVTSSWFFLSTPELFFSLHPVSQPANITTAYSEENYRDLEPNHIRHSPYVKETLNFTCTCAVLMSKLGKHYPISLLLPVDVNTKVIRKVRTVCAYLSRILETVTLHMCSDFLYQLRSHRRHFVKFVLCLCLFLCVKHV